MSATQVPYWIDPGEWIELSRFADKSRVRAALTSEDPGVREFAVLLSEAATPFLEEMAQKAQIATRKHFGRTISLYVPLYLSNFCSGGCLYCGFSSDRKQPRKRLESDELIREMDWLKSYGFEDILLLTGERSPHADFQYLLECVSESAKRFHNVAVEAFSMTQEEYGQLARAGCTGVTLYQETYDGDLYEELHRWGEKRDYLYRLEGPARALAAGMRSVGVGVLLGLADPIADLLSLFRHVEHLRKRFWQGGLLVSFPRICSQKGGYQPGYKVEEAFLAQSIFAFRICQPEVSLVLSTREGPLFRDGMAGVGINRMSISSKTTVGGYSESAAATSGQFDISDTRDLKSFCAMLESKGLQPVFKNWDRVFQDIG